MKIGGVELKGPNEEILVLPRLGEDIVFKAKAVTDMEDFEALCPEPTAPGIRTKDGFKLDENDATYKELKELQGEKRMAYIILKTLEPSEIEWDEVDLENPGTWLKWKKELNDGGISDNEINLIIMCVMQANSLDESKLTAARENFLLGLVPDEEKSSGPQAEQQST